jgi:hypothetical protein
MFFEELKIGVLLITVCIVGRNRVACVFSGSCLSLEAILEKRNKARRDGDLERLGRINVSSRLSLPEATRLVELLRLANFKRDEVIVGDDALWYRLPLRGSSFLSLDLHEQIAFTLLKLRSDSESRNCAARY